LYGEFSYSLSVLCVCSHVTERKPGFKW